MPGGVIPYVMCMGRSMPSVAPKSALSMGDRPQGQGGERPPPANASTASKVIINMCPCDGTMATARHDIPSPVMITMRGRRGWEIAAEGIGD